MPELPDFNHCTFPSFLQMANGEKVYKGEEGLNHLELCIQCFFCVFLLYS